MHEHHHNHKQDDLSWRVKVGLIVFAAIAFFYLWLEHRVHLLGVLPYLIFLLCPIMHFFMHGGHGSHGSKNSKQNPDKEANHES